MEHPAFRTYARLAGLAALVACGSSGGSAFDGGTAGGGDATVDGGGVGADAAGGGDGGIGNLGDGAVPDGGSCTPPDVLVVLDRTDSMSDTPNGTQPPNTPAGHALTKWYLATQAVKALVAPPGDQSLAFGLEPFPLDPQTVDAGPGGGTCKTLTQLLGGSASNNKSCQPGEVLVPPATGKGAAITAILDPETFRLCVSTPIALALGTTAQAELKSIAQPGVAQYVLLVTDGAETCKGDVVAAAQQLAAAGVKTFVVGFGAADAGAKGVDKALLDQVACAGMTATGFPAPCTKTAAGYTATSTTGPPLFYLAEDGAALAAALKVIASHLCCGCAQ